jgi:transcriptional regulator with XRE-family HTH domain
MPSLAAFPAMLKRDRERNGLRVARAAWVCGVTVRRYRELEAGAAWPSADTYERIVQYLGWPQSHGSSQQRSASRK